MPFFHNITKVDRQDKMNDFEEFLWKRNTFSEDALVIWQEHNERA